VPVSFRFVFAFHTWFGLAREATLRNRHDFRAHVNFEKGLASRHMNLEQHNTQGPKRPSPAGEETQIIIVKVVPYNIGSKDGSVESKFLVVFKIGAKLCTSIWQ
jgi:hypothetical protein